MLPYEVLELRYYLTASGESPFESWFSDLDAAAAAKVSVALVRLGQGNTSSTKSVGEGVLEYRIDWGPGYRVYFGRDGETVVILLTGGAAPPSPRRSQLSYASADGSNPPSTPERALASERR